MSSGTYSPTVSSSMFCGTSSSIEIVSPSRNGNIVDNSPLAEHPYPDDGLDLVKNTNTVHSLGISQVQAQSPDRYSSKESVVPSAPIPRQMSNADFSDKFSFGRKHRQRLRPWLIDQINSGEIPGLEWIDKEKMIFKIPWKHFGRPEIDMSSDALLFRRWAMHTKRFDLDRPSDVSNWKTRIRCALHKLPGISLLKDQQLASHRVYQFLKIEKKKKSREGKSTVTGALNGSDSPPISDSNPIENTTSSSSKDTFVRNSPPNVTGCQSDVVTPGLSILELIKKSHVSSEGKIYINSSIPCSQPTSDAQVWLTYDHLRDSHSYPAHKSIVNEETSYENEKRVFTSKDRTVLENAKKHPTGKESRAMKWKTYHDEVTWTSQESLTTNESVPLIDISIKHPKHSAYHPQHSTKEKGFQPYRWPRNQDINVIDDDDIFFPSCAQRIKKLDMRSSGYLKLKILEQFLYVENMFEKQDYDDQNLRSLYH